VSYDRVRVADAAGFDLMRTWHALGQEWGVTTSKLPPGLRPCTALRGSLFFSARVRLRSACGYAVKQCIDRAEVRMVCKKIFAAVGSKVAATVPTFDESGQAFSQRKQKWGTRISCGILTFRSICRCRILRCPRFLLEFVDFAAQHVGEKGCSGERRRVPILALSKTDASYSRT